MADYPVSFDVRRPDTFDRAHVAIRLVIAVILALLGGALGWSLGVIYLVIPVVAAILISQKGAQKYHDESGRTMTSWLRYIVAFHAYFAFLTDKLPNEPTADYLEFEVTPSGTPTPGAALMRILLALPSAIVLALLWVVGFVLSVIAGVLILYQEHYDGDIYNILRGIVRWEARLLAYLASLVDEYPPFAFDQHASRTWPEPPAAPQPPADASPQAGGLA
ncbi:MAG TPA: DUF4389 domain-containing protein [Dehalococcoidia bacterium]